MIAKHKKGFRKIVVNEHEFSWRFTSVIDIRPKDNQSNKLIVDFGWVDVWLYVNDEINRPLEFEPKIVTPSFVQKSICFALANGWDINSRDSIIEIKYENEAFQMKANG